ncbi:MAG: tetratricopeptide repeat protein [Treponema sp.]|jgi:putative GTP pyrophosphokinase|nr:tetratricopeptide repeat protein [Treponema sp.]
MEKLPDRNTLRSRYDATAEARRLVTRDLAEALEALLQHFASPPLIKGRPKEFNSYYKKYLRALKNGGEDGISDLIGLRVICPFLEDLSAAQRAIRRSFTVTELDHKGSAFSFKEFGYESIHLLIEIPGELLKKYGDCLCTHAEIQIRTILQDAWAEVEHELVYKAEFTPFDDPMKRKLAAVNASLSLADSIFQEIRSYQRQLNSELGKRRDSFYRKIEEATDGLLFEEAAAEVRPEPVTMPSRSDGTATIDDLLLNALYAHNKNRFEEAIGFYSRILEMKADPSVTSLIYKHRGMANFAQSRYDEAIEDFGKALEYDPKSYKAAYYKGVVHSVQREYEKAVEDFSVSLEINPYQNFTLYRRGQAYYHEADYPAALADCEASLALDPASPGAAKFRELLLEKLKMRG